MKYCTGWGVGDRTWSRNAKQILSQRLLWPGSTLKVVQNIHISVQEIFTAEERMDNSAGEQFHFGLMCCGAARSFDVGVCDAQSNEVSILKWQQGWIKSHLYGVFTPDSCGNCIGWMDCFRMFYLEIQFWYKWNVSALLLKICVVYFWAFVPGDSLVPENEILDSAGLLSPGRCGGAKYLPKPFYQLSKIDVC